MPPPVVSTSQQFSIMIGCSCGRPHHRGRPAGLATAIAASRNGLDYQVIEKAPSSTRCCTTRPRWVFFTTPELMEIGGCVVSPYDKPTRLEALRYYRRVSDAFTARHCIRRDRDGDLARAPARRSRRVVRRDMQSRVGSAGRRTPARSSLATARTTLPQDRGPCEDLATCPLLHAAHPFFRKRVVSVGGKNSSRQRRSTSIAPADR